MIVGWHWYIFALVMGTLLVFDLVMHRGGRGMSTREAVWWSAIWIGIGLAFAAIVYAVEGSDPSEYLAAYAMEKSLSLDNMFVFLLIFKSMGIPAKNQHTALVWGIFGALVFRAGFIAVGLSAVERWSWVTYVFGALLLWASYHAVKEKPGKHLG